MTALVLEQVADPHATALDWAALWDRCPAAAPFQHPAWLLPWWEVFGTRRPRVATLRDGERLLGMLPLYAVPDEGKLLPIGAGLTDYQDALIAPEAPADAADALLRVALDGPALPCHLPDLPPAARMLGAATPRGWRSRVLATDPCPVLDLGQVPARQRRKVRMAAHRAARAGGAEVIRAAAATLEPLFEALADLHAARWQARGEPGVLADPAVRRFHALALPRLYAAGLLRLRALRLAGRIAAVIHALRAGDRLYLYLGGFDAAFAHESPGTLLLGAMLDEARAGGATECHFLRGAEPYKYAWGATDRVNTLRILEPA